MKNTLILTIVALAVITAFGSNALAKGFGLGVIIGEPTGPSFKAWTGANTAIDGAAAWSLDDNNSFHLHLDYLMHANVLKIEKGKMPLYYGIGGRMEFVEHGDDDIIGVRIPVGLEYLPHKTPLGIFLEIVPVLNLIPETDMDMEGAIGIRLYL
ncbi:MAG: hypothetical protein R3F48_15310 [Candidatus Zixiibacteriota bacterium]